MNNSNAFEDIPCYISALNIPCTDNGKKFIDNKRVKALEAICKHSEYRLTKKASLSRIYEHKNLDRKKPIIFVSCHIDSIYKKYWNELSNNTGAALIKGTLDNSACVGILAYLVQNNKLPPNVVVAFTGNEEQDGKGAKQVSKYIKKEYKDCNVKYIISLDLTNDFYNEKHYTIENINGCYQGTLSLMLPEAGIVEDAAPDDSWTYKKYFPCFSLCLPCENIGEDMHSDKGVRIKQNSLVVFSDILQLLLEKELHQIDN